MNLDEYQKFCLSITKRDIKDKLFYAAGLLGEVTELFDLYKKLNDSNKKFTVNDLLLESGDVLWYFVICCASHNIKPSQIESSDINEEFYYDEWHFNNDRLSDEIVNLMVCSASYFTNIAFDVDAGSIIAKYEDYVIYELWQVYTAFMKFIQKENLDIDEIIDMNVLKLKKKWGIL